MAELKWWSREVPPTVASSEKYMEKDMDTGKASGLGPIAQPTTPGYVQIHMVVFFWLLSVPSHTDFEVVDILTLLPSDDWSHSTWVMWLAMVLDMAINFAWEKRILD